MTDTPVRWYQHGSDDVIDWEFQYRLGGGDVWTWADPTGAVQNCVECFMVSLDLPVGVAAVRSRAIGLEEISEWSAPAGVAEPGSTAMMLAGLVLLRALQANGNRVRHGCK